MRDGGYAWQGVCVAGGSCMAEGACVAGGRVWHGGVCGRGACMAHTHPQQILRDTVNEWAVRILLECILVYLFAKIRLTNACRLFRPDMWLATTMIGWHLITCLFIWPKTSLALYIMDQGESRLHLVLYICENEKWLFSSPELIFNFSIIAPLW